MKGFEDVKDSFIYFQQGKRMAKKDMYCISKLLKHQKSKPEFPKGAENFDIQIVDRAKK